MLRADPPSVQRIGAIGLVVADLEAAIAFYREGLGFAIERREIREGEEFEALTGIGGAHAEVATMSLGGTIIELARFTPPGSPYPAPRAANDPWFQHFAVRVSDMPDAYARFDGKPNLAISIGGPQQLPPSTGSVIAYKFRDPDGNPLELSFVPGGPLTPLGAALFLAVDHSAIAVADLDASLGFYVGELGFRETGRLLNQGPAQWRLDGIEGVLVDIVVLEPAVGGPHLELLHYRTPVSTRSSIEFSVNDIGATRLTIEVGGIGAIVDGVSRNGCGSVSRRVARDDRGAARFIVRDPDGHLVVLHEQPDQHVAGAASPTMTRQ